MEVIKHRKSIRYCYIIMCVVAYNGFVLSETIQFDRLFPSTWYTQALEVCMRVLADKKHAYDAMTASDLCVGRLIRLYDIVEHMEVVHTTKRPLPKEDITYMLALVRTVCRARDDTLTHTQQAQPLVKAIELRLVHLIAQH